MYSMTSKPLDAVYMAPTLRQAVLFKNRDVLTTHGQRGIGVQFVGVVQAVRIDLSQHQSDQLMATVRADRGHLDHVIALQAPEQYGLPSCTSTEYATFPAYRCRFVAFLSAIKWLARSLFMRIAGLCETIEAFHRSQAGIGEKALPVDRHTVRITLQRSVFNQLKQPTCVSVRSNTAMMARVTEYVSTIVELPTACMEALGTFIRRRTSINLTQFN